MKKEEVERKLEQLREAGITGSDEGKSYLTLMLDGFIQGKMRLDKDHPITLGDVILAFTAHWGEQLKDSRQTAGPFVADAIKLVAGANLYGINMIFIPKIVELQVHLAECPRCNKIGGLVEDAGTLACPSLRLMLRRIFGEGDDGKWRITRSDEAMPPSVKLLEKSSKK